MVVIDSDNVDVRFRAKNCISLGACSGQQDARVLRCNQLSPRCRSIFTHFFKRSEQLFLNEDKLSRNVPMHFYVTSLLT